MNIESPIEYGPHFPDKEQVLAVFKEFGQDAEESKTAVGFWRDERHAKADLSESRINRPLVDIETGILFIEAGFRQLAIDCYNAVCDVLEFDESLADEDYEHLRSENEKLADQISVFIDVSEK
jgi:hypothetical protein